MVSKANSILKNLQKTGYEKVDIKLREPTQSAVEQFIEKNNFNSMIFAYQNVIYALTKEEVVKVMEEMERDSIWYGNDTRSFKIDYIKSYEKSEEKDLLQFLEEMSKMESQANKNKSGDIKKELINLISNGATQIILTGAPGTGKTRMAKEVAEKCGEKLNGKGYEFVQFHPSYDYTDFVEGLRPIEAEDGNTTMVFRKVDGIFKKFCREVEKQNKKEKKYFFLIDEINRADLSKVFGELMFCLETDKRGKGNAVQTQYQNLPTYDVKEKKYYGENEDIFANGFYIPENVIIIGTMNDIDRSVESMDFALRRRFIWKEVEVTQPLVKSALEDMLGTHHFDEAGDIAENIATHIMKLNEDELQEKLGKHYYISQGQFANLPGNIINQAKEAGKNAKAENKTDAIAMSLIDSVWNLRLESLLYEYIRGEGNEQDFVKACKNVLESGKESTQGDSTEQ